MRFRQSTLHRVVGGCGSGIGGGCGVGSFDSGGILVGSGGGGGSVIERILAEEKEIRLKGLWFTQRASSLDGVDAHVVVGRFVEEELPKESRDGLPVTHQHVESQQSDDAREDRQNDAQKSAELIIAQRR